MTSDRTDRSLAALLGDLSRETVDLVRQEAALARAEVKQTIATTRTALTSMAGGAVVALGGFIVLLLAVVNGLAIFLPPDMAPWLSPLIVGGVVLFIGWLMLRGGRTKLDADHLKPRRTMDSLRRDHALVQEKAR